MSKTEDEDFAQLLVPIIFQSVDVLNFVLNEAKNDNFIRNSIVSSYRIVNYRQTRIGCEKKNNKSYRN